MNSNGEARTAGEPLLQVTLARHVTERRKMGAPGRLQINHHGFCALRDSRCASVLRVSLGPARPTRKGLPPTLIPRLFPKHHALSGACHESEPAVGK